VEVGPVLGLLPVEMRVPRHGRSRVGGTLGRCSAGRQLLTGPVGEEEDEGLEPVFEAREIAPSGEKREVPPFVLGGGVQLVAAPAQIDRPHRAALHRAQKVDAPRLEHDPDRVALQDEVFDCDRPAVRTRLPERLVGRVGGRRGCGGGADQDQGGAQAHHREYAARSVHGRLLVRRQPRTYVWCRSPAEGSQPYCRTRPEADRPGVRRRRLSSTLLSSTRCGPRPLHMYCWRIPRHSLFASSGSACQLSRVVGDPT